MPVTTDQPAPYAPPSAILDLIERHRNRGLPPVVDADVLLRAGISDSLVARTLQALRSLDLLTDDGRPTEILEAIRLAPSAEYEDRLTDWLRAAYADALAYIDPSTDDEIAIRDAFRKYMPTGQQSRMVTLFVGLFTAAGVMPLRNKLAGSKKVGGTAPTVKPSKTKHTAHPTSPASGGGNRIIQNAAMPPALAGLLATLPIETKVWTKEQRDKFMATFAVVVDYSFEIGILSDVTKETAADP